MPTRWIEAGGVQLRYELTQPDGATKAGSTIVLVHEMGGMIESWAEAAPLLSRRGPVLAYDQRGSGLSEKPFGSTTTAVHADDLAALLDALEIGEKVAVVGCAVGAAIAATFAARHPGRVAALAMLSPATCLLSGRAGPVAERAEALREKGVRAAYGLDARKSRSRYDEMCLAADPRAFAEIWSMLAAMDMDADLAAIACPTLVAAGRRDASRPPEHVRDVAAKIAGARYLELDTGHIMALDTPELTASTIVEFLAENGL